MSKLPDIEIRTLTVSQCVALKLGDIYDFFVCLFTDDDYWWRGICRVDDLQACVEAGFEAFRKYAVTHKD